MALGKNKEAIQKALVAGSTLTMTFSVARGRTLVVTYASPNGASLALHESRTVEEAAEDLVEIAALVEAWA